MALQPLADRIVAKPVEAEAKTASGILLPDQAKEQNMVAKVIAVGKDVKEVKVDDLILHPEFSSDLHRLKRANQELLVMKEELVLAVIEG